PQLIIVALAALRRSSRSIERQPGLAHEHLGHDPHRRALDRIDVGIAHQQRIAHESEAPRRVEEWARDPTNLAARRIQYRDLIWAKQPDIEIARPGERDA